MSSAIRVRKSITELQNDYNNGNKKPLEDLMRAWKGVKELPPDDPHSFFTLGGYHGEPFRGGGWGSSAYWGGYCNHGNILFPTWHRVYLFKLEEALRSIPGCQDVTLPFWDETSDESLAKGIPWALTTETFVLDGTTIPNPLRSFVFNRSITDNIQGDNPNYSKPLGYETVRYPLSGLVGNDKERAATKRHNDQYKDYNKNVQLLNENIIRWLTWKTIPVRRPNPPINANVHQKFVDCLGTPNYLLFSNTSSARQWNADHNTSFVPLESPHNSIHLAVGGFDVPKQGDFSPIPGANGDMGENDTAGLDPIFFFHHCFIDYVFWRWQVKQGKINSLDIPFPQYPGTNTIDNQGPTPGVAPNTWLSLESPLAPFTKPDGTTFTSLDALDIEAQLDYKYGPGSLDAISQPAKLEAALTGAAAPVKALYVSGLDRSRIAGSFLISAYAEVDGEKLYLGSEAVLSRWSVRGCINCQTHLETKAAIRLHGLEDAAPGQVTYSVEVHTRETNTMRALELVAAEPKQPFLRFEVR